MKFTKHNNPNRCAHKQKKHSAAYIAERREEMWREIGKAIIAGADPNGAEVNSIIKAFNLSAD